MNLRNKKELAAKALGVGKNRIWFNPESLAEIKEAITKEDIKSLFADGIIRIKPVKGRKIIVRRKIRRGPGKIKKKVKTRKQDYVKITRKLRKYVRKLKMDGSIGREEYIRLRKKIRMREFKSRANLGEYVENLRKTSSENEETETKPKTKRTTKNKTKTKEEQK
ncbi:MAG: 50S ribosomal protein L19e [Nanoarchaeota archaeon]